MLSIYLLIFLIFMSFSYEIIFAPSSDITKYGLLKVLYEYMDNNV